MWEAIKLLMIVVQEGETGSWAQPASQERWGQLAGTDVA